jgi:4-diphosphocytidyl-2-C-methyl-D-erythritol kinase
MRRLNIRTAAKINLCLRVLGRRADAYHEVETVIHSVGIWDRLQIQEAEPGVLAVAATPEAAPQGEDNLCWLAASLLRDRAKVKRGAAIRVEKAIPIRSGLGGGSSDAAATLAGLVRLWNLDLGPDELEGLAADIGADVPFFLRGGCCLARGRGERLAAWPELSAWLVLVVPERRVSTAQAYAALKRGVTRGRRRDPSRPVQRLLAALEKADVGALAEALHNDFEGAAMAAIGDALQAKQDLLNAGCVGAAMSGSGSAVYGIAPDEAAAKEAASRLGVKWPWVAVAPTLSAEESLVMTEMEMD